jgi:predicted Zn-dependent protease
MALVAMISSIMALPPFILKPAFAQSASPFEFIRDAEIENYLRRLATPIYQTANLDPNAVNIALIKSNVLNAFVAGGMNQFFFTGLLLATDTPEQLAGVIAHETGHIAGGHLVRGSIAMRNASAQAIIGTLLGVAAGVASGNSQVTAAAVSGSQQIAQRGFLTFSRAQESSADAAALNYLDSNNITARGLLEFMQKLAGQELLPSDRQSEYVRTHPLTQDRIDAIQQHLDQSRHAKDVLPVEFQQMHERMKAKLMGFLQPQAALLRYTDKDPRTFARYARAIALYQTGQLPRALPLIDTLLDEEPNNPFYHELKGQMLFENSRVAEAVPYYKKSVELQPDSTLLRTAYARALLESRNPDVIDITIQQLQEANRLEARQPEVWRLLASAWGRKGELSKDSQYEPIATYALAEEAVARGANKEAKQLAERALKGLPKGSSYWIRAQDIKFSTEAELDE